MKTNCLSNLQSLFLLHLKKMAKYICYFVLNTPDAKYAWIQIFTQDTHGRGPRNDFEDKKGSLGDIRTHHKQLEYKTKKNYNLSYYNFLTILQVQIEKQTRNIWTMYDIKYKPLKKIDIY